MHAYRAQPETYSARDLDRVLAQRVVDQRATAVPSSLSLREPLLANVESMGPADRVAELHGADRRAGVELARRLRLVEPEENKGTRRKK